MHKEDESKSAIMDLNLYLGLPRSSPPRNLDMGADLALSSLRRTASSDSSESGAPEVSSMAMEESASHASCTHIHAFFVEADVPSTVPLPPVFENPIFPYYLTYESCESTYAQCTEGSGILHSPSNAQVLQSEQVFTELEQRDQEHQRLSADLWWRNFVYCSSALGDGSQVLYSPSYHPVPANFYDEENNDAYLSFLSHSFNEVYSSMDLSLSQQDLFQPLEPRNLGLIESDDWRRSSLMPPLLDGNERTNLSRYSSTSPERLMVELTSSRQSLDTNRKNASTEVVAEDSSEKEAEENNRCATDFECNICFDKAKEPVVTSCGHLFCWPCLYQWLHVYSDQQKCPVCKGEVTEANITPIYGRGCSKSDDDNKDEENFDSGLPIPPRPRGNRLESLWQSSYTIPRRIGEEIANYWGNFLNYNTQIWNGISRDEDSFTQQMLSERFTHLIRPMTRELQREQWITEGGLSTAERFPTDGSAEPGQEIHCFPANDRLAAMDSEIESVFGRFTENANFYGSTSSVNSPNPWQFLCRPIVEARPATDQASASGTVAVINSESCARHASAESNSAGCSRPSRRIRESSSDDDGENLCKRRRLH